MGNRGQKTGFNIINVVGVHTRLGGLLMGHLFLMVIPKGVSLFFNPDGMSSEGFELHCAAGLVKALNCLKQQNL